jgi:hypothetical protein
VLSDTKKVLVSIVHDKNVSVEEFRLMATLAGATLDCFFRLDEERSEAIPFQTKEDIVKQLLYTDRKIRHIKAKAGKHTTAQEQPVSSKQKQKQKQKQKHHRHGGQHPSFTEILWDRRVQFLRILLDRSFPIVMTMLGVPPPAQGIIRKILDNMVESAGKTKSNHEIIIGKQKQIEYLLKQIDQNKDLQSIQLNQVQNRMTNNTFLEYSKDNLGNATKVHRGADTHWSTIDKHAFADHVQSYTHNVIYDISKAEQNVEEEKPNVQKKPDLPATSSKEPLTKQEEYYELKLMKLKGPKVKETKKVVSVEKKKKDLDNVIKFLKVVVAEKQAKKHHAHHSDSQEKWLNNKVELIEKNVKNPLFYRSTKWIQENPVRSVAIVGALSCVAFAQLLSMVEDEPDEYAYNETPTAQLHHENIIKQRAQRILQNVKTRHLITSVPVLLSVLFVIAKRHTLGKLSDMLAGSFEPQKDKIVHYISTDMKTYEDTQQCLRTIDRTLHHKIQSCKTAGEVYYVVCTEQFNRRKSKFKRAVLNGHLLRKNGEIRDSVAEVAVAVQKIYKRTDVAGRFNTKRKAVFANATQQRRTTSNTTSARKTHRKKHRLFGRRRRTRRSSS